MTERNRRSRRLAVLAALAVAGAGVSAWAAEAALPADFRSWTHVRAIVIPDKEHDMYGFHDVFANKAALAGLRSGDYKDGAQFVLSIREVENQDGVFLPGAKRRDLVQTRDPRSKATGGWSFAAFGKDGKPVALDPVKSCFPCHESDAKDTQHVFVKLVE